MECREFQKLINDFLNNMLEDNELFEFVEHALECQECYDELDIYFTLQIGLELAEQDLTCVIDFKQELTRILNDIRRGLIVSEKISDLKKIIVFTTEAVVTITSVLCIMSWI